MRRAMTAANSHKMEITKIRRKAAKDGLLLEVQDPDGATMARVLASKVMKAFPPESEVRFSCPQKKAEIRMRDIVPHLEVPAIVASLAEARAR